MVKPTAINITLAGDMVLRKKTGIVSIAIATSIWRKLEAIIVRGIKECGNLAFLISVLSIIIDGVDRVRDREKKFQIKRPMKRK